MRTDKEGRAFAFHGSLLGAGALWAPCGAPSSFPASTGRREAPRMRSCSTRPLRSRWRRAAFAGARPWQNEAEGGGTGGSPACGMLCGNRAGAAGLVRDGLVFFGRWRSSGCHRAGRRLFRHGHAHAGVRMAGGLCCVRAGHRPRARRPFVRAGRRFCAMRSSRWIPPSHRSRGCSPLPWRRPAPCLLLKGRQRDSLS